MILIVDEQTETVSLQFYLFARFLSSVDNGIEFLSLIIVLVLAKDKQNVYQHTHEKQTSHLIENIRIYKGSGAATK